MITRSQTQTFDIASGALVTTSPDSPAIQATSSPETLYQENSSEKESLLGHGAQKRGAIEPLEEANHTPTAGNQPFLDFVETQWRPINYKNHLQQLQDQMTDLITASTQAAIRATENAQLRNLDPKLLPTFNGWEWEDPNNFLLELEEIFQEHKTHPRDQLRMAFAQLDGEAKKTFEAWRSVKMDFTAFKNRLLARFNDPATLGKLRSRLHGEKQKDDEPVGVFIRRKMGLHQRVEPYTSEEMITCEIKELMKPEIRYATRQMTLNTLDELSRAAEWAESDYKELQKSLKPNLPKQTATAASGTVGRIPSSPCRTCQGWHFHKDCPYLYDLPANNNPTVSSPLNQLRMPENSRRTDVSQGVRSGETRQ